MRIARVHVCVFTLHPQFSGAEQVLSTLLLSDEYSHAKFTGLLLCVVLLSAGLLVRLGGVLERNAATLP